MLDNVLLDEDDRRMQMLHQSIYEGSKLSPEAHSALVDSLSEIARRAGVTPNDVAGREIHLTDFERDYLLAFRRVADAGECGLVYEGRHDPSVIDRCRSAVGALVRNFIDARLVTREELVSELFAGRRVDAELVAVPDLHYDSANAATRRALNSWLTGRAVRRAQTIVAVPSRRALTESLGPDADDYLRHYRVSTGVVV